MKTYLVKWELDVPADSPREAAEIALAALRSDGPKHKVFKVVLSGGHGTSVNLAAKPVS